METQGNETVQQDIMWKKIEKSERRGKVMGGLLIIAIGSLFLARELGADIPTWVFSWKMLLIALGVVAAVKHKFLHPAWIVLVGVGTVFLLNDLYPDMHVYPFIWPVLIILVGLFILLKPRRRHSQYAQQYWKKWHEHHHHNHHNHWHRRQHQWQQRQKRWAQEYEEKLANETDTNTNGSSEDYIESVSFLGGVKKIIISKKFKGGDLVHIFGGAHINLSQADFEGTATLSITQIFGGTKLIVPANWEIKLSESVTVCGSIEDKRPVQPNLSGEPAKVLMLVGTTVFGGIEIKSYNDNNNI